MKKKYLILNSRGGVGKTYQTKLFSLKAERDKRLTYFMDVDNASASLTNFFNAIEGRKSEFLKFANYNLVGADRKIDRTKFDLFLSTVEKLDNVCIDFGAASSEQFIFYMMEESKNNVIETFKEIGIEVLLIMAGGGSAKECVEFFQLANSVQDMGAITHLVANEYHGGIKGKSVQEYTGAKIQITRLHDDVNSDAQKEWDKMMADGVVYTDILSLNVIRKRRIVNYLDRIFDQIDSL